MEETIIEKDIIILDEILKILIEKNVFTHDDFIKKKNYDPDFRIENVINDFSFYLNILSQHNLLGHGITSYNEGTIEIKPLNVKAQNFYKLGGFKSMYQAKQISDNRQKEMNELSFNKLKKDSILSKWQVITYWITLFFALIGGTYSIIEITQKIIDFNGADEQKTISNDQLVKEISKLQILINKMSLQIQFIV